MTKRKRLAFVIDWIGSLYHARLVEGVRRACRERDVELTLYMCGRFASDYPSEMGSNLLFDLPDPDNCDGLVIGGAAQLYFSGAERAAAFLKRFGKKPVATIGFEVKGYPSVVIDSSAAINEVVRHLVRHHHYTDFFCVTGSQTNGESSYRLFTLQESLFSLGIPLAPESIHFGDFLYESGRQAGKVLLGRKKLPQVVICFSDAQACGVMDELGTAGLRVPRDIALTGFDNGEVGKLNGLTTIALPFSDQAYQAARSVLDRIEGKESAPERLLGEVIFRRSCGCGDVEDSGLRMERLNLADHFVADYDLEIINEMGICLYGSLESSDLVQVLREQLARLDVHDYYLGLFSDPADPLKEIHCFAAVSHGRNSRRFENRILGGAGTVRELRAFFGPGTELIFLTLFQGDNRMGLLVLHPGLREIKLLELIRQQLSGVIKGRLLFEQILQNNRELEKTVALRTCQLQEANDRLKEALKNLEEHNQYLHRESILDPLTGLHNRRGFSLKGIPLLKNARAEGLIPLMIYVDLDGLKEINDTRGHAEGDRALICTAEVLLGAFRPRDVLARLGGDEFAVLVEEGSPGPSRVKERIRGRLARFNQTGTLSFNLSFSIGCASGAGDLAQETSEDCEKWMEDLLSRADRDLYADKQNSAERRGR